MVCYTILVGDANLRRGHTLWSARPFAKNCFIMVSCILVGTALTPLLPDGLWQAPAAVGVEAGVERELIVVRHGETDWNRELRVQGRSDISLNARGHEQAKQVAKAFADQYKDLRVPDVIYSSMLGRAAMTATAIATAFAASRGVVFVGRGRPRGAARPKSERSCNLIGDVRLNEWNLGVLEGLKKDEAKANHAEDWAIFSQWCSGRVSQEDGMRQISGGESMDDVRQRAVESLENALKVALDDEKPVIAVTHGGVIGQLLRHAISFDDGRGEDTVVDEPAANGSISRFMVVPGGPWRIASWSETAHLDAAPAPANYDSADGCPVPS